MLIQSFLSYIVQNCERAGNHWALFEAWVVTASYILAMASKYRMAAKWWNGSFELCCLAAVRALDALCQECAGNQTAFIQGDPLTDGDFYPMRMTILAGALSALSLYHRLKSEKWERQDYVHDFLSGHIKDAKIWGESATPYMVAAALELENHGAHRQAERLIMQMMHSILALNSQKGRGFANPYYGPEQVFRLFSGMDPMNSEVFIGHSYHLEALIEMLARRLLRTTLAHFWEKITRVHFTWFKPAEDWEWFRLAHLRWDSRTEDAQCSSELVGAVEGFRRRTDRGSGAAERSPRIRRALHAGVSAPIRGELDAPHRSCTAARLIVSRRAPTPTSGSTEKRE